MHRRVRAYLALENGAVFAGYAIGAVEQEAAGEVVFNTAMSGYEEILTDPSYRGQIVTFTYPHIGNYGITLEDGESERVQVEGIVVHECSPVYSNWRAKLSLQEYLQREGVVGIEGVDTRMLVRMIREYGALRGVISATASPEELVERARSLPPMEGQDLTDRVGCRAPYWWTDEGLETGALIAVVDFGVKRNICGIWRGAAAECVCSQRGWSCTSCSRARPMGSCSQMVRGPGRNHLRAATGSGAGGAGISDSGDLPGASASGACPWGADYKLKFGHHGANHPVLNLHTGVVEITSQNHGFAVDPDTLPPELEVTHINLNDGTLEGMQHRSLPVMSVQYHPEAAPGPHDATYIFDEFLRLVRVARAEVA
jgi:carbamoyl-phosphate synthase small subunit